MTLPHDPFASANVFPVIKSEDPGPGPASFENLAMLNAAVIALKAALDATPFNGEQRASVAMLVAVEVLKELPDIKARRGKIINAITEDFRRKLQLHLPL